MLPPVFQALKSSAAVKAIVGSNPPRVYRHGRVPDQTPERPIAQPFITWSMVSNVPENNLSDPPPCDRTTVQVDCWHQTDKGVEDLAIAARDALEVIGVVTSGLLDDFETETKLFRMSLQVDIWLAH
jgi:hypothetical protein